MPLIVAFIVEQLEEWKKENLKLNIGFKMFQESIQKKLCPKGVRKFFLDEDHIILCVWPSG